MAYKKVSIEKNNDGAGCAVIKDPTIYIVDVADIEAEPTRELGDTTTTGNLELKLEAKAIAVYATPTSIEYLEEGGGEADAKGIKQGIAYEHPGNSVDIKNHTEAFLNKGVVIIHKECDGTAAGRATIFGSKCNPLFLTPEATINKEATKRKFTWKQEQMGKFLPGEYTGTMPAIAPTSGAAAAALNEGA